MSAVEIFWTVFTQFQIPLLPHRQDFAADEPFRALGRPAMRFERQQPSDPGYRIYGVGDTLLLLAGDLVINGEWEAQWTEPDQSVGVCKRYLALNSNTFSMFTA